MPVALRYPGVYIEEVSSGVRTITGVSTSVTAFVGTARRGRLDTATRLFSFADFERAFGGLAGDSLMSYAVRQFFLNGGSEALVVRIAKGAGPASYMLTKEDGTAVLKLEAIAPGTDGGNIAVEVDYRTSFPASTFNLTLRYQPPDNPADARIETFRDLSMNSRDARYVETMLANGSELVTGTRQGTVGAAVRGNSTSRALAGDMTPERAITAGRNRLRIAVDGGPPIDITIPVGLADWAAVRDAITAAHASEFTWNWDGPNRTITITSPTAGEYSSVRVLPAGVGDVAANLKLGTANGGTETDAAASLRPAQMPNHGTLQSGAFGSGDLTGLPGATAREFNISVDGYGPDVINIAAGGPIGEANLAGRLRILAERIENAVRSKRPGTEAYATFHAEAYPPGAPTALRLVSGTRGEGSTVVVSASGTDTLATTLKLVEGSTMTPGRRVTLAGGSEQPIGDGDAGLYAGLRDKRTGMYALEQVDLFNLLCLPGVTDRSVLAEATVYCEERRAFLIVDAPQATLTPPAMLTKIEGTDLPKSDHAAVYYPWIKVGDPLRGGQPKELPPSGAVAGLYARTDSARGVWKAPAGTDATLVGVQDLTYQLTDPQNGTLNPLGVNCLRIFPVYGPVVWGARTLRGADMMASEYKYVPVRRLALYIEESLFRGLKWVVFEPNDEPLWAQIRLNAGAFMNDLFRQGAFKGQSTRDAYFVKCDRETTTQSDINRGVVNILVGFAPLKPAEFVVLQLQQIAGQIQV